MERVWKIIDGTWKFIEGAGKVIESVGTITEGARQVEPYMNIDGSIRTLKRKFQGLRLQEEDVKTELQNAELVSSGTKRRKTVEHWATNVQNLRNQVDGIDTVLSQRAILHRPQLASEVKNLTEQVEELLEQGKFPEGLTVNTPYDGGVDLVTKPLVGQAFQENLEKIWRYLMEPEVVTIGVWGMGGVGKTTLVTHINNRARQHLVIFSNVFWVTVSQNLDIRKLQNEFAKAVNLSFNNEQDERKRAATLSSELKKSRFLFILDDLWHHIDLDRVGIPVRANGSKLIITTRSLDVCQRLVCQQKIKVEPLSENEAWDLFEKNLGHQVEALSPEVYDVARLVARECGGLPLGIITVAKCMKGVNDAREWRSALKELGGSKDGQVEIEEEVFHVLQFSYNHLRDPKLQQSFLYCALYPEDSKINREELVQRLIDEGIIEAKKSRKEQFDTGHTILNQLVRCSLLEGTADYGEECVKMHDLLRDMAINMKSIEFMVKSGMQLKELPDEQEWSEHVERVSLMQNQLKEVAMAAGTTPRCPKLSTLLLSNNYSLKRIEDSFFEHTPALQILDLTRCKAIKELPDSVSNLKNLTALVLYGCCNLRLLPSLAELESMKRLDLCKTGITEVPHGLERLVRLTYLDLRADNLKVFPTRILPHLVQLEFLKVKHPVEIKGEELQRLERLSTFEGNLFFVDVNDFKSYVMSGRPHNGPNCRYRFELNDTGKKSISGVYYNHMYTVTVEGLNISERASQEEAIVDVETMEALLKDVHSLDLVRCFGARNLWCSKLSCLNNATQDLKQCRIFYDKDVQSLVPYGRSSPYFVQNLEKLVLYYMANLELLFGELGRGGNGIPPVVAVAEGAFSCLKVLKLCACDKIKILFHHSFLPNLRNLQEIVVGKCDALQEIVAADDSEGETSTSIEYEYALPNLTTLELTYLPQLKSICEQTISCPSLCKIKVEGCPQLKRMPLSLAPSSFESIEIRPKEWWESAEWDHPNAKELLKPYLKASDS